MAEVTHVTVLTVYFKKWANAWRCLAAVQPHALYGQVSGLGISVSCPLCVFFVLKLFFDVRPKLNYLLFVFTHVRGFCVLCSSLYLTHYDITQGNFMNLHQLCKYA